MLFLNQRLTNQCLRCVIFCSYCQNCIQFFKGTKKMSTSDDCCNISGVSNISRISKSNNSLLYKVETSSNLDFRSSFLKNDSKKLSDGLLVIKNLGLCEDSTCEYAKLMLVEKCLQELATSKDSKLNLEVQQKLKSLLTVHELKKYTHLPNESKDVTEELTLLGLIDLEKPEFTLDEQTLIKRCLESKLREKLNSFNNTFKQNSDISPMDLIKNNESKLRSRFMEKGELESLQEKDEIDEVIFEFKKDLTNCGEMLSRWQELKLEFAKQVDKDTKNFLLQAQILELKAIIAKLTCKIRMYKETPFTAKAFKILNNSLDEKILEVSQAIIEKNNLKKAYEDLKSSVEYNEILRKYTELCDVVKKKKCLLEKL